MRYANMGIGGAFAAMAAAIGAIVGMDPRIRDHRSFADLAPPGMPREASRQKALSSQHSKRGPGRYHETGSPRPVWSELKAAPFGRDRRGNPIPELPLKYMHSHARRRAEGFL